MKLTAVCAALSPYFDRLIHLVGDVTVVVLCLAVAYLAYGIAHDLADILDHNDKSFWKLVRIICRIAVRVLLYVIAGLHGLEYLLMKAAGGT